LYLIRMRPIPQLTNAFVKVAALNALALIAWLLLHSSPSPAGALVVWTLAALAGLLDIAWIAIGAYAFVRARRAS